MKKIGDALWIFEAQVLFEAGIAFWAGFAQCLAPRAAELAHRTMWRVLWAQWGLCKMRVGGNEQRKS